MGKQAKKSISSRLNIESIVNIEALTLSTVLLAATMVLSCSKKEDSNEGNDTAATPISVQEIADSSEFLNFQSNMMVPVGQNELEYKQYIEERYGTSCLVKRNSNGEIISWREKGKFDSSLKAEDVVFYSASRHNPQDIRSIENSIHIRKIDAFGIMTDKTVHSIIAPIAGGELLLSPITETEACVWRGISPFCSSVKKPIESYLQNFTPQGFEYFRKFQNNSEFSCVQDSTASAVVTVEKGIFKLQNGAAINAFRTIEVSRGPIVCNGVTAGIGEIKTTSIHSLEVKAVPGLEGFSFGQNFSCGGALVAESKLVRASEKIMESIRFEQKLPALK